MVCLQASRLVLAVQLASAALSLPLHYVTKSWRSLLLLLGPVMLASCALSFLLTLLFFPSLGPLPALWVAACLTPTDPVLASTILQGRFAET